MIQHIFWTCLALIAYSYFIYPLIMFIICSVCKIKIKTNDAYKPKVTLLISAYNEEKVIEQKIKNSLSLNYPKNKLQIIITSDGSTDNTDKIVKKYKKKGINLIRVEGRKGKNIALNKTMKFAKGEIIAFSDANSMYKKDAIIQLTRYFADKRVGCVSGDLKYDSNSGEGLYSRYEHLLKLQESKLGQLLSANGAIFAIRKQLFQTLYPTVPNDFQTPQDVANKGYKVIYAPSAIAYEKASTSKDEFNRKIRIIARGMQYSFNKIHKFKGMRLFELLSHKILRWFIWLFLIIIFISNIFLLNQKPFAILFYFQLIFYALALLGPITKNVPLISIPYYFCTVNLAAMVGFFKYITGKSQATWETAKSTR